VCPAKPGVGDGASPAFAGLVTAPEQASREGVRGRPGKCVCENARRETEKFLVPVEFKIDEAQAFMRGALVETRARPA
jgi:hypothetical protein